MFDYRILTVNQLKKELIRRGARTTGRKEELIERLDAYERNFNFRREPVLIPSPHITDWPTSGFHQLTKQHRLHLPKLTKDKINAYFKYRVAMDGQSTGDIKGIQKGEQLLHSNKIYACSVSITNEDIFLSSIIGAAMKKKVSYSLKLKLNGQTGQVVNSHCECPAGKGPHGTCKHVAAVLLMLVQFLETGIAHIKKSCTENLQTHHKPHQNYEGSPIKAEDLPCKGVKLDDPRPHQYRQQAGYQDHVRNLVFNFCAATSKDMTARYMYPRASLNQAVLDHDYLLLPYTEYWVDEAVKVTEDSIRAIEEKTREQSQSRVWFDERRWRITASRFGDICKATERRNKKKLCQSITHPRVINTQPVLHGKQNESTAISNFETQSGLKVHKCGLFVHKDKPYIGATPDGVIDENEIVEVKCPYAGRNSEIKPGKMFPFLTYTEGGEIKLKEHSKYYIQIQGQMFITGRKVCHFIVYTFEDMFLQKVEIDREYCEMSIIPKLDCFYEKFLRPFIASEF